MLSPRSMVALTAWLAAFVPAGASGGQDAPAALRLSGECTNCDGAVPGNVPLAGPALPRAGVPVPLRLDRACQGCGDLAQRHQGPPAVEAIVSVRVNLEPKGDLVILIAQDGDILVSEEEFKRLGLSALEFRPVTIRNVRHVSLRAAGARFTLDQAKLELSITVDPKVIAGRRVVDLGPVRSGQVIHTESAGSFLNYNMTASGDDRAGWRSLTLAGELGLRLGEYLFVSDGTVGRLRSESETSATRLSSSLVRERLDTFERTVIGDFVTTPGALGTSLRLGGVSFSKRYTLDPYFVRFPGQIVSGTATLPSDVFLYSNGVLIRRESIAPGGYEFQNLISLGGLQVTEVVVRDVLGNEQRVVNPFYFSDSLLRPGLAEYSFDAGLERRQFGTRSNDYGKPGAAAFYRVGVTPGLTLGGRGEWLDGGYNAGPSATFRLGLLGVASLSYDYGRQGGANGSAFALSHSFQDVRFGTNLAVRGETRNHFPLGARQTGARKLEIAGTVSHALPRNASVALSVSHRQPWEGDRNTSVSVSYRQRLVKDVYLSFIAQHTRSTTSDTEATVSLSYNFDAVATRPSLTLQARHSRETDVQAVQVAGGSPEGEGLEYRVNVDVSRGPDGTQVSGSPFLQYNFPRFVGRAEYVRAGDSGGYQVGLAGAVAAVGGAWGLSRPVTDSFGFVKVGEIPGVRVSANNQFSGRTGSDGTLFIPRLASHFENAISIEDRDLPMNAVVPEVRYIVAPAYRSGVFLDFRARRVQAVAGRLVLHGGTRDGPFAQAEGELRVGERSVAIYTARDGSFYAEDVGPGEHAGIARRANERCEFALRVPETTETVVELGEVGCDAKP